ncbi:MAG: RIP metalloprotease RseP [Deltaproteobacteria bacterium]|jgi:regulator of sigma E protease|nr:RIP metalloprotease RseP [Deltaproteobacteria bacterium]
MTFIYFVITLGILIFIHELGHFIMAKRAGIRVDAFSLGFGPRLIGFKKGDTDYRISLFPIGGYVRMLGEDPTDEGADDPQAFAQKSVWARAKVVAFGPIMNMVLCLVLMPIVFMIGRTEPVYLHEPPVLIGIKAESPAEVAGLMKGDKILSIDGAEMKLWSDTINRILLSPGQNVSLKVMRDGEVIEKEVVVGELPEIKGGYLGVEPVFFLGYKAEVSSLVPGGPAEKAGLKPGDLITSYDGRAVADFYDFSASVNASGGEETSISVSRDDGTRENFKIQPTYSAESGRWVVGIYTNGRNIGPQKVYRYGFVDSIILGVKEDIKLAKLTFEVLYRLITLKLSYKVLGGPIVIAKVSAQAAASGLGHFLYFMAFLSLQLSILNILPIPVLDGGHLMFLGIEAIQRKPLSAKFRSIANQTGFIILMSFMVLITLKDIDSIWGVSAWIKNTLGM